MMHRKILQIAVATVLVAGTVSAANKSKTARLYHWVDQNGAMHYGDRVPAEFASTGHDVMNGNGVVVKKVDGQKSAEQIAEEQLIAAEADRIQKEREAAEHRDKTLLKTYLSVEEIENLRDQRSDLLTSQLRVTEVYLGDLHAKIGQLEKEAQKFAPYSPNPDAKPIDEKLAGELSDTLDSIMLYEANLNRISEERGKLLSKFDQDIVRFKQLTSKLN
jgi:hypothetical protein